MHWLWGLFSAVSGGAGCHDDDKREKYCKSYVDDDDYKNIDDIKDVDFVPEQPMITVTI